MGCTGSSHSKVVVADTAVLAERNPPKPGPLKVKKEKYLGVKVGMELLCLDSFQSKYTGETIQKWRECRVRVFDGYEKTSKVCLRFKGWSESHDQWLDLDNQQDASRLAPLNLLSSEQIENGESMDDYQCKVAFDYLQTGTLQQPSPTPSPSSASVGSGGNAYVKGQKVDIQDVLVAGAEKVTCKWRTAEVMDVAGSKLRVHFIGWEDTWDEVIDLRKDSDRVRQYGSMTSLQGRIKHPFQKSLSEGVSSRRTARRSFDGDTRYLGTSPVWEHEIESHNGLQDDGSDNDDAQSACDEPPPSSLLQNKKASKPTGAARNKQRFPSFASNAHNLPHPKPAAQYVLNRRHSSSGVDGGSTRRASCEVSFLDRMETMGLHVIDIEADGNCLFRAVAHQLFLDPEKHVELRAQCVEHMAKYRDRFEVFCTSNFDHHLRRMAIDGTWAAELEIRALEEIADRVFSIYSSDSREAKPVPMNTNFDEQMKLGLGVETVKLSYHGNHYNSIFDQKHALPLPQRKSSVLMQLRTGMFKGLQ